VRWSGLRHPRDMGAPEVEAFFTMLATQRRVSASTHKQALSALLFLYRKVLMEGLRLRTNDVDLCASTGSPPAPKPRRTS
jgi:hypothetical protein